MPEALQYRRSAWPHRWAWMLACATFPLVWWGGFVSATGAGMAFRDWLTSDGVFMPLYPWLSSAGDKFIEHGHRLLAMLAGCLSIALVVSTWLADPRRWVRWYSAALLGGVLVQGALGGMRVLLDERVLALVHGCTGPMFFAASAAMVVITSRRWQQGPNPPRARSASEAAAIRDAARPVVRPRKAADRGLVRLATLTAALALLQVILGALVRHTPLMLSDDAATMFRIAVYFHVLVAFVVAFYCLRLGHQCYWRDVCRRPGVCLAILVIGQLALGGSTWLVKYGLPSWAVRLLGEVDYANQAAGFTAAAIAAGHGAVGSLILALCVVIALEAARQAGVCSPSLNRAGATVSRAVL